MLKSEIRIAAVGQARKRWVKGLKALSTKANGIHMQRIT